MLPAATISPLHRGIFLASALGIALLVTRWWWTGSLGLWFLGWNLFLAGIPLLFGELASRTHSPLIRCGALGAWLLFFPNAPYLVTDLLHLGPGPAPLWFDLGLLSAFAVAGLFLAVASLVPVHRAFRARFGAQAGWLMVIIVCGLSGFGIYLGRFLRFNSWDVAIRPLDLAVTLLSRVVDPFAHPRTWGVTLLFGALTFVVYISLSECARRPTPDPQS